MGTDSESVFWYVLFATKGKAAEIKPYLEAEDIEYFYPMIFKEIKIKDSQRKRLTVQPLLGNLLFVRSSRQILDPLVEKLKLTLGISSGLYYRDLGTKELIRVPEQQMRNFIAVAGSKNTQVIYLTNKEVNLQKGKKVRVTSGEFEGVEGVIMRIKGDSRVVVVIPNLLSVATAYIPAGLVVAVE